MSFKGDIAKFKAKAEKNGNLVFRKIAFDIAESVIKRTPVDQGRAKGNWQVSTGSPTTGVFNILDKTGSTATSMARDGIQAADLGDKIFITNNLPYIQRLENGWSLQAPNGMVAITVSMYRRIASRAAKQVLR